MPQFTIDETGAMTYHYDPEYIKRKYQVFNLQVIHRSHRTGFEETKVGARIHIISAVTFSDL